MALIALTIGSVVACASKEQNAAIVMDGQTFSRPGDSSLVLTPIEDDTIEVAEVVDMAAWESARLDGQLGAPGSRFASAMSVAEVRHYERLRSSNGRPRDDSWTFSRSLQRRSGP